MLLPCGLCFASCGIHAAADNQSEATTHTGSAVCSRPIENRMVRSDNVEVDRSCLHSAPTILVGVLRSCGCSWETESYRRTAAIGFESLRYSLHVGSKRTIPAQLSSKYAYGLFSRCSTITRRDYLWALASLPPKPTSWQLNIGLRNEIR